MVNGNFYLIMEAIKNKRGNTIEIKISWCAEDVEQCAKNMGKRITRKQAGEVLDAVLHKHDATIGVNWEVLEYWIDAVLN